MKRLYNENFKESFNNVIRWEVLSVKTVNKIRVKFVESNSPNRQGIRIGIDVGEGYLKANGVCGKAFDLWEDECPGEFDIESHSEEGYLSIYNIFERNEEGIMRRRSQMAYSGMILEQDGNTYRYKCNDTGFNTEFNKLIFEIELIG